MLAATGRPLKQTWQLPLGELVGLWRAYQCEQARFAAGVVWAMNVALGGDSKVRMDMLRACRWQKQARTLSETYGATMAAQIEAVYKEMDAKLAARRMESSP